MIKPRDVIYFYFGMMSMWNFMRTTYVFGGAWGFYVMDIAALLINVVWAILAVHMVAKLDGELQ